MVVPRNKAFKRRGYTLIEIGIVLLIVGALMTMSLRMLDTFIGGDADTEPKFQFEFLFQMARNRALTTGRQYTLEINLDKKKLSIRSFSPVLDSGADAAISKLTLTQAKQTLAEMDEEANKEEKQAAIAKAQKEIDWVIKEQNYMESIHGVYSVTKLQLTGPIIRAFFYPNGSSDSLIFQIGVGDTARYLYLPRTNAPARYLDGLKFENDELDFEI